MNAIQILEHIGTAAMLTLLAWEMTCIGNAISAESKAPLDYKFSALRAVYLWHSLVVRDLWKLKRNVPNVPITSSALIVALVVFIAVTLEGYGTHRAALGIAALAFGLSVSLGHMMLRSTLQYRIAAAVQSKLTI